MIHESILPSSRTLFVSLSIILSSLSFFIAAHPPYRRCCRPPAPPSSSEDSWFRSRRTLLSRAAIPSFITFPSLRTSALSPFVAAISLFDVCTSVADIARLGLAFHTSLCRLFARRLVFVSNRSHHRIVVFPSPSLFFHFSLSFRSPVFWLRSIQDINWSSRFVCLRRSPSQVDHLPAVQLVHFHAHFSLSFRFKPANLFSRIRANVSRT